MVDLLLVMTLGFLGSFGHCVGMCGPLTVAFSLTPRQVASADWKRQLFFHGLLNLGRILSYALVGAGIGAVGSVLIAGGQLAGIDSVLRRSLTLVTGCLLIWMGLAQVSPQGLPQIPLLHPFLKGTLHERLNQSMMQLSQQSGGLTPALLGFTWGLIPCGFLYAAQIKAAETGNLWQGAVTMLAFGLGTVPSMLGIGLFSALLSTDRRSQLFRSGGWVTLAIGILTLLRTDQMVDYTGHAALLLLILALIARPIARFWAQPLQYRRALGVGAFALSVAHTLHMIDHTFNWNSEALVFMLPMHQVAIWSGTIALLLMLPAALTSFDWMVNYLGKYWRRIHLLTVPALLLAVTHAILIGSSYLGKLEWTTAQKGVSALLAGIALAVLLIRSRWAGELLKLDRPS
ncbi:sulfite exporter TauE/SafE family protein [Leptothermofonsia sichuanensis E412]|uniref:urease accessory protein UreH domain-containing protein n=1 Tax=Leptothermofonsia sichuanensis TaxID=2917832 RepID=UPI001CA6AEF2|nr:sulfite exporter TauE/SafE family protein [Leptothermofonsia sichuanensis]QZZ20301.1 sulfite exporter TauE/SafE family protein [Leptothermofonsia sichuanensis E412]